MRRKAAAVKSFPIQLGHEEKLEVSHPLTRSWFHTWVSERNDEEMRVGSKKKEIKLLDVLSNLCHFSSSIGKHRKFFVIY